MTTPSGKLMWGQAGAYDGIDDRAVVAAVTGNRTGLIAPAVVTAGTGLNLTVAGGWLGVAACGDSTSAVVGSRTDQVVTGAPGPATGSRTDYIWCDVQPDSATWSLAVIPASTATGRPGMALATLTVPANATLASQMTIAPAAGTLERTVVGFAQANETNTRTANSWASAVDLVAVTVMNYPGRWYKVRFTASSPSMISGGPDMRISVGVVPAGQPPASSVVQKTHAIPIISGGRPVSSFCELVYQYPAGSAAASRTWSGRIWITGTGSYRTASITDQGQPLVLTVEDLGT